MTLRVAPQQPVLEFEPLSASFTSRLRNALAEYGPGNAMLLGLQQVAQRLAPSAIVERLYIVAQPVPPVPGSPVRRGQDIGVRRLLPGDPALGTFTRIPAEIDDRFAQGAVCLGAFRGTELLGWIWFVPGAFSDYTYPLDFQMEPAAVTSWDFDVYVRPDARLSAAFARLWEAAFDELRARGIRQTLSAISAFNPASLRAHRRLGMAPFGSVLVLRLGHLQAVLSHTFPPRFQWSPRRLFRAVLKITAPL